MRHTPGPWTIKCIGGQGFKIKEWNGSAKEDSANAHLIASAPELLEACYASRMTLKHYGCKDPNVLKTIEQAIAKAEGGV